jgi:hypothetical protein
MPAATAVETATMMSPAIEAADRRSAARIVSMMMPAVVMSPVMLVSATCAGNRTLG